MDVALLVFAGVLAGVCGGLFGIGGGIVIVPFLVYALHFSQKKAQGTSLVALLAPVGLFGLIEYWKAGEADLTKGAWIALGFFGGAFLGSRLALGLDEVMMRRSFAVFLIVLGTYMFARK